MKMNKKYSVTIYSENVVGQITTLSNILSRRNLNIISFYATPTDIPGISMITIVTEGCQRNVRLATLACEYEVDVAKAFSMEGDLIANADPQMYKRYLEDVREYLRGR